MSEVQEDLEDIEKAAPRYKTGSQRPGCCNHKHDEHGHNDHELEYDIPLSLEEEKVAEGVAEKLLTKDDIKLLRNESKKIFWARNSRMAIFGCQI